MLDTREISIGCLLVVAGFTLGLGLLVLGQILENDDLGRWGVATLAIAGTFSLHRSLAARDERMREAFTMGRDYERARLTSVR